MGVSKAIPITSFAIDCNNLGEQSYPCDTSLFCEMRWISIRSPLDRRLSGLDIAHTTAGDYL